MAGAFLQKSRHGTVFYFRRKLPRKLHDFLGRKQIFISLGTQDRPSALIAARRIAVQFDELVAIMQTMKEIPEFKNTPLGQLIEQRKIVGPLKDRIDELTNALLDSQFQHNKER